MQINYTGRRIDVTPALSDYADKKIARLERHYDGIPIQHIDMTFDVEKVRQIVEAKVSFSGGEIKASSDDEDMYAAIDALIDKLDRQMIKHKEKNHNHHNHRDRDRNFDLSDDESDND